MRVAVVGGAGVLGRVTAVALREAGIEPVALSRTTAPALDLTSPTELAPVLDEVGPDVIVNLAAMTDVAACERAPELADAVNARGAASLAAWASDNGRRLVHVSTDAVFDGRRGWYVEEDAPAPINAYAASKLRGEEAVLAAAPDAVVVRCNYLSAAPRFLLRWMFDELRAGHTITGYTDSRFTPLGAPDLALAFVRLVGHDVRGLLHVGGREGVSKHEVACHVRELLGSGTVAAGTVAHAGVPRPADTTLDSSLARTVIDHPDRGWRRAVVEAVDEMKGMT